MIGKLYLGDGVYANFDGYYLVLTTEDGKHTSNTISNTIYLEPTVIEALKHYIDALRQP